MLGNALLAQERIGLPIDDTPSVGRVGLADTHCIYIPPLAHDDDLLM